MISQNETSWELGILLTMTLHWPTSGYFRTVPILDYFPIADHPPIDRQLQLAC